jgi:hypothetical protein
MHHALIVLARWDWPTRRELCRRSQISLAQFFLKRLIGRQDATGVFRLLLIIRRRAAYQALGFDISLK